MNPAMKTLLIVLSATCVALSAAPKKRAVKKPPAARVSALSRAAAREHIQNSFHASPAHFENAAALIAFFGWLEKSKSAVRPVHILQFGDSHTASDDWVNSMRMAFQAKYGDGGPGFIQAGYPFRGYRRFDARAKASDDWITQGTLNARTDGYDGLSGISITTRTRDATIGTIATTAADAVLTIHYLQQPGGGALELSLDGQIVGTFPTDGASMAGFYRAVIATPGEHQLSLRKTDAEPVRLFGWALENTRGMTFETLGINGAQIGLMSEWNEVLWSDAVAQRDPSLVILAYGTNEANSRAWTEDRYRADLTAAITRVKTAAPLASILLIGPPDCGRSRPLVHLSDVIAVERDIAKTERVAFWDLRQRMGGPGSANLWVRAGYGQQDHIHLTPEGYRLAGRMIYEDIEAGYTEFLAAERKTQLNSR